VRLKRGRVARTQIVELLLKPGMLFADAAGVFRLRHKTCFQGRDRRSEFLAGVEPDQLLPLPELLDARGGRRIRLYGMLGQDGKLAEPADGRVERVQLA